MVVVVGLGNPGPEYEHSRHNVGYAVVEELARRWQMPLGSVQNGARSARGIAAEKRVALLEPQLYMNRSGPALQHALGGIEISELIVIHDDLDLELGRVRVKRGGGSGGHNGVASIIDCFGPEFTRVRIGIGRPSPGRDAVDHVLSKFETAESAIVTEAIRRAADATECVLVEGADRAMNTFNSRPACRLAD